MQDSTWHHPTLGQLDNEMLRQLIIARTSNCDNHYSLMLGTDSQLHENRTRYVTALIIHDVGHGATYVVNSAYEAPPKSLRQKIWRESHITLTYALFLEELLEDVLLQSNVEFQVHVDCGYEGPTRELIREVTQFFNQAGYTVVVKPDSAAASSAANRHSK